ncbi:MAG: hypothetical protein GC161_04025 [Planctomycetaceae bacterium]|nr:hypothetical protein [Planctomycetaceae bacterium]
MKPTAMFPLLLATVLPLFVFSGEAHGQDGRTRLSPERRAELLERWRAKPEAERALLRERFQKLRDLNQEARQSFVRRAELLLEERERLAERPPRPWKQPLEGLDPAQRREALRQWQEGGARWRSAELRPRLPEDLGRALRGLPPERRPHHLETWHRERGPKLLELGLAELDRKLNLGEAKLEELRKLAPEARRAALLDLRRRALRVDVATKGPPLGLDHTRWAELEALPDEEFFRTLRSIGREELAETAEALAEWRTREPGGTPAPELLDALAALARGRDGARPVRMGAQQSAGDRALLRPSREEWTELSRMEPAARVQALGERLQSRVRAAAEADGRLTPAQRERLLSATPRELIDGLQHLVPPSPRRTGDEGSRLRRPGGP